MAEVEVHPEFELVEVFGDVVAHLRLTVKAGLSSGDSESEDFYLMFSHFVHRVKGSS